MTVTVQGLLLQHFQKILFHVCINLSWKNEKFMDFLDIDFKKLTIIDIDAPV